MDVGVTGRLKMGIYVDLWMICVIVQQKTTPYCKAFVTESKIAMLTAWQANKSETRWWDKGRILFGSWLTKRWQVKCERVKSPSSVWLLATLWTVAHQAPLSMGFSRQEYWSGLPFPSPGDVPEMEIKTQMISQLQADSLPAELRKLSNSRLVLQKPSCQGLNTRFFYGSEMERWGNKVKRSFNSCK